MDIGVRVEVRDEVMKFLNENLYEAKLVYYTPTFDDKVRTFCTNPSGEVATEYYENGLAVVNGHAYKSQEYKTNNTNFALLVSKTLPSPSMSPLNTASTLPSFPTCSAAAVSWYRPLVTSRGDAVQQKNAFAAIT